MAFSITRVSYELGGYAARQPAASRWQKRTIMPPIGVSYGRAGMIGLWRRVPADSRHFMLPAGVAVRLHQGGPEESVAGGLQADSGHGTGAYTGSDEACPRRDPALPAHKSLRPARGSACRPVRHAGSGDSR